MPSSAEKIRGSCFGMPTRNRECPIAIMEGSALLVTALVNEAVAAGGSFPLSNVF